VLKNIDHDKDNKQINIIKRKTKKALADFPQVLDFVSG
jgi:hypothetical protein